MTAFFLLAYVYLLVQYTLIVCPSRPHVRTDLFGGSKARDEKRGQEKSDGKIGNDTVAKRSAAPIPSIPYTLI
jgi:hypothetical protein